MLHVSPGSQSREVLHSPRLQVRQESMSNAAHMAVPSFETTRIGSPIERREADGRCVLVSSEAIANVAHEAPFIAVLSAGRTLWLIEFTSFHWLQ